MKGHEASSMQKVKETMAYVEQELFWLYELP